MEVLEVTPDVMTSASRLLFAPHLPGLRSLDAIQLATASWWSEQLNVNNMGRGVLVVADRRLRDAALALRMQVENPEDYE